MDIPEEDPKTQESPLEKGVPPEGENLPGEISISEEFHSMEEDLPARGARRRRTHRMLTPPGDDDRSALLDDLSRRAFPSFEFFLFAFLSGLVLGIAYLLDSPALLLLGTLLAPLLTPWVGLNLATLTGSWRFFFQTLGGLLVAFLLVFLTGMLAGFIGKFWLPSTLTNTYIHSHLWWPDLFLVILGAVVFTLSFVRSGQRSHLASIILVYELFLPVSAAGFGLVLNQARSWPDGLPAFLVYISLAILTSCIILAIMRFKPVRTIGYLLPVIIFILALAGLFSLTGLVDVVREGILSSRSIVPTSTSMALPSLTVEARNQNPTSSPTITLSPTPEISPTFTPTPVYAMISAAYGGGALVRSEPGSGSVIATLSNGSIVQIFPEIQSINGTIWVHVLTSDNKDGWVFQDVLKAVTLTPTPSFTPTLTVQSTRTSTPVP